MAVADVAVPQHGEVLQVCVYTMFCCVTFLVL